MNDELRKAAEEAGWVQNYATRTSAMFTHTNGKTLEVCKESIQNTNRWRVSVINSDRAINDTDGLKRKDALELANEMIKGGN